MRVECLPGCGAGTSGKALCAVFRMPPGTHGGIDISRSRAILPGMLQVSPPTAELMAKIRTAMPPRRFPPRYFDPLVEPARLLLDRGLSAPQAADFLIVNGAIKSTERKPFIQAMHGKISRLRRAKLAEGGDYRWRENLYHNSSHLVNEGEHRAICGADSTVWVPEVRESSRCPRCIGVARKNGLMIAEG